MGDRVELGGIVGDVIDVGVLRTTLFELGQWVRGDQHKGGIVRAANSLVFRDPVFNYSAGFPFLWDEIAGPYVPAAQAMHDRLVKKYMIEPQGVEPVDTMSANDNWIEYTVRYVVDYRKRRSTKDQIYERILDEFDRSEDRVAIASTTVQIVETPVLDVRLGQRERDPQPEKQ